MQDGRWDRFGALAGIFFVVLAGVAAAMTGAPPTAGDSDLEFQAFFVDKSGLLVLQAWLYAICAPLLLWFAVAVRRTIVGDQRDAGYLPDLFLAGTTANAALLIAFMALQVAVTNVADRMSPETVRGLGIDFGAAGVALFGFIVAVTAMSFAVVVRSTNALPRWVVWLAATAAVLNVVGTFGVFGSRGAFALEGGFTVFVPSASTLVWYFGTSIAMLQASRADPDPGHD